MKECAGVKATSKSSLLLRVYPSAYAGLSHSRSPCITTPVIDAEGTSRCGHGVFTENSALTTLKASYSNFADLAVPFSQVQSKIFPFCSYVTKSIE